MTATSTRQRLPEVELLTELFRRTGPLPAALPSYSDVRPAAAFGWIGYDPVYQVVMSTGEGCQIPVVVLRRGASREEVREAIRQRSPDAVILSASYHISADARRPDAALGLMRDIIETAPQHLAAVPELREKMLAMLTLMEL